jgi:23S rRNA pseudouridine1911/1915/1917 synthase
MQDPEQQQIKPENSQQDTSARQDSCQVGPEHREGIRVDLFLAQTWPEYSRSFFQKCLSEHRVLVNQQHCRRATKVWPEDQICIFWPPEKEYTLLPEDIPLDIIMEDEQVIVLNKPAGMVVHPAQGNDTGTLVHGLLHHDEESFEDMSDESRRPGIVHRLDKDTSGVLVVAKNLQARAALKEAFKEHVTEKTYLAIVLGCPDKAVGVIENLIGRHPVNRLKMAVVEELGKFASTRYRVLASANGCSLLEIRILTGRTHQIRVHFSHLKHPVLGDALYGGCPKDMPYPATRQLLHAWKLVFPHPETGVMRQYMAELPEDFQQALSALGLPAIGMRPKPLNPPLPKQGENEEKIAANGEDEDICDKENDGDFDEEDYDEDFDEEDFDEEDFDEEDYDEDFGEEDYDEDDYDDEDYDEDFGEEDYDEDREDELP